MIFLLADCPQKLKLEKVHGALIILLYLSPIFPSLQSCFKENGKHYLKTLPLKIILQFEDRICIFLLKTQKTTTLWQATGGKIPNIVLKRMLELFLKIQLLQKILEFQD